MRYLTFNLFFATFIALFLSSCGNREEQEDLVEEMYANTLSVHALFVYEDILRHAGAELNASLSEEGQSFQLDLTTYEWGEREYQRTRLQTMFMAGQGYDVLIWEGFPLWLHADSGFFANFYNLIDQDPNSSREDFFVHVLAPLKLD